MLDQLFIDTPRFSSFQAVYRPEGQVERDVHRPQRSCDGVQQTHLLGVQLPALTGHVGHSHQAVASIQQPGGENISRVSRVMAYCSILGVSVQERLLRCIPG